MSDWAPDCIKAFLRVSMVENAGKTQIRISVGLVTPHKLDVDALYKGERPANLRNIDLIFEKAFNPLPVCLGEQSNQIL